MARYIDAEKCKDLMYVRCLGQDKHFVEAMKEVIDDTPTEDAKPVIRCKNCKHCYHSVSSDTGLRCDYWGTYDMDCSVEPNMFCCNGAKMDGE